MKNSYTESLAHITWKYKYHIVFAPKYGRKEIYGELKKEILYNNITSLQEYIDLLKIG